MRRATLAASSLLTAACLFGTACGSGDEDTPGGAGSSASQSTEESPPASDSPSPDESASAAVVVLGEPFYGDDFRTTARGWPEKDNAQATYDVHTEYATPAYTITAKQAGYEVFSRPEFRGITREQLSDYHVRALIQTNLSVGHTDQFGVICRELEGDRYVFQVGYDTIGTGTVPWRIAKQVDGKASIIASGDAPSPGGSAFEVGGSCIGGADGTPATLVLTVNNTELGRGTDADSPLTQGLGGVTLFTDKGKTSVNVLSFTVRPASLA
jgi:hypothetical protein